LFCSTSLIFLKFKLLIVVVGAVENVENFLLCI
jgi:hypothetical protein